MSLFPKDCKSRLSWFLAFMFYSVQDQEIQGHSENSGKIEIFHLKKIEKLVILKIKSGDLSKKNMKLYLNNCKLSPKKSVFKIELQENNDSFKIYFCKILICEVRIFFCSKYSQKMTFRNHIKMLLKFPQSHLKCSTELKTNSAMRLQQWLHIYN